MFISALSRPSPSFTATFQFSVTDKHNTVYQTDDNLNNGMFPNVSEKIKTHQAIRRQSSVNVVGERYYPTSFSKQNGTDKWSGNGKWKVNMAVGFPIGLQRKVG